MTSWSILFGLVILHNLGGIFAGNSELVHIKEADDEAHVEVDHSNPDYNIDDVFQATHEWQEIRPGQVIPPGLHVRINLETNKKEAKLMEGSEREKSIKNIDDFLNVSDPIALDLKDHENIKSNTEFELIQNLMAHFDNSSESDQLIILDDLEYLLHQYDNARDFVNVGGLAAIVTKGLNSSNEEIKSSVLQVFSSCVQSHDVVKEKILSGRYLEIFLHIFPDESDLIQRRLVHAFSCLIRNHQASGSQFKRLLGPQTLLNILTKPIELKLRKKILVFLSDTWDEDIELLVKGHMKTVCESIGKLVEISSADDITLVEELVQILVNFGQNLCQESQNLWTKSLKKVYLDLVKRNSEELLDMEEFLAEFYSLIKPFHEEL